MDEFEKAEVMLNELLKLDFLHADSADNLTSNMRALFITLLGYNNMLASEELDFLKMSHLLNHIAVDMLIEGKEKRGTL